ncbi:MAG: calcium/sodium antiporter [Gammaproteobacteria bacterium]|nr:MAG: calcium/sodium antiporter [Gammaproteobacteria bacterium]
MLMSIVYIVLGVALLTWAAERFVMGASALARNLGVAPMVIGLTVVGIGTSTPELVISVVAALRGNAGIALGNAIGSNIANIALVLGITAMIRPLEVRSETLKREYPVLLLVSFATLFVLMDGELSRQDGIFLLTGMAVVMVWMVGLGLQRPKTDPLAAEFEAEIPENWPMPKAVFWLGAGLVLLPLASRILVRGAVDVALALGVNEVVIGLTVVAIGTSLPELAAAVMSAIKREPDLAIGTVIGSNLFNTLGVLGLAATISPIRAPPLLLERDYSIMLGLTVFLFLLAYGFGGRPGHIHRRDGALLLAIFISYIGLVYYTSFHGSP